eukprot:gene9314-19335_t
MNKYLVPLCLFFITRLINVAGYSIEIDPGTKECYSVTATSGMPVSGSFEIFSPDPSPISVTVVGPAPHHKQLFESKFNGPGKLDADQEEGNFSFDAETDGDYTLCIANGIEGETDGDAVLIAFNIRTVVTGEKDYQYTGLEAELDEMKTGLDLLVDHISYMNQREDVHRVSMLVVRGKILFWFCNNRMKEFENCIPYCVSGNYQHITYQCLLHISNAAYIYIRRISCTVAPIYRFQQMFYGAKSSPVLSFDFEAFFRVFSNDTRLILSETLLLKHLYFVLFILLWKHGFKKRLSQTTHFQENKLYHFILHTIPPTSSFLLAPSELSPLPLWPTYWRNLYNQAAYDLFALSIDAVGFVAEAYYPRCRNIFLLAFISLCSQSIAFSAIGRHRRMYRPLFCALKFGHCSASRNVIKVLLLIPFYSRSWYAVVVEVCITEDTSIQLNIYICPDSDMKAEFRLIDTFFNIFLSWDIVI